MLALKSNIFCDGLKLEEPPPLFTSELKSQIQLRKATNVNFMEQFDFKSCFEPGGHRAHEARLPGEAGHFWKKRKDIS